MSYLTTVTERAHSFVAQTPALADRSRLLLAALPAGLIAVLLPAAYRDYQSWLLLGPGGPPYNVFGWLLVKLLFDPLRREPFGTLLYDRKVESGEQASFLSNLPHRKGQRPAMGEYTVPQRQVNQRPSPEVRDKLMAAYGAFLERNAHIVDRVPSILERHTDAAHVCGHVPLTPVARQMKREICHVHGTSDYSLHVTLAPADCKRVIESGWGQRFTLAGSSVFRNVTFGRVSTIPTEYVLIYAPRDEEEIEVVIGILKAGVQYFTGLGDVK